MPHAPNFDQDRIAAMLADPQLRLQDIADTLGCTREWVRQVGRKRGLIRDLSSRKGERTRRLLSTPPDSPEMRYVWEQAKAAGLKVERIRLSNVALRIQGLSCAISVATRCRYTQPSPATGYVHFIVSKLGYPFTIGAQVVSGFPYRIFVLPAAEVLAKFPRGQVDIPSIWKPLYRGAKPRLNWRDYENAWHLIAEYAAGLVGEQNADRDTAERPDAGGESGGPVDPAL